MDFRSPLFAAKDHWSMRSVRWITVLGKRRMHRSGSTGLRWDLGIRELAPQWKALFSRTHLTNDITAGLTVACIALPLSFAIALASGVKPEVGLISAIVGGIVCALLGGTPLAVSGPAAAMSVLVASNVEQFGLSGLLIIGCLSGLFQVLSGILGLGKLSRFVPSPVIAGFTAGIGAIIFVGQLPRALGLPPPDQAHILSVLSHLTALITDMKPMVFGLTALAIWIMLKLPKLLPKLPAPLLAVAVPTLITILFGLDVPLVGEIPRTLPLPRLPELPSQWTGLLSAAFVFYAVASLETLLSSSAIDRISRETRHDSNQELIGQGIGNFAVSLFGGIPVTGVITRSALNVHAGAKTRRSAIFHAAVLLAVVFVFSPIMSRIPIAALAGILLAVALNMLNPRELKAIMKISPADGLVYIVTMLVVVFADLLIGVQAGIFLAFLIGTIRMGQARIEVHRIKKEGPLGFSVSGSLTFLSSAKLDVLRRRIPHSSEPGQIITLDLSRVTHMDATGATELAELISELEENHQRVDIRGLRKTLHAPLLAADGTGAVLRSVGSVDPQSMAFIKGDKLAYARHRLMAGVESFQTELKHNYSDLFKKLAQSQTPHTLFITCSDSRILPHLLTQTDPGELFVVRNVGNIIPVCGTDGVPSEGAAIEYAVGVLGVSQIVICGHSSCGAMREAISGAPLTKYQNVQLWLNTVRQEMSDPERVLALDEIGMLNVRRQIEHLKSYPVVRTALDAQTLTLNAWFFDVFRGSILEWSDHKQSYVEVSSLEYSLMNEQAAVNAKAVEQQIRLQSR